MNLPTNTTSEFTQLCRGGWTLANIFFFTPIKPGVLEVYEL